MDGTVVAVVVIALAISNVLPAVLVLASRRVAGQELTLWFFAVLFASWLGFVAFMSVTTLQRQKKPSTGAGLRQSRGLPVLDISDHSVR